MFTSFPSWTSWVRIPSPAVAGKDVAEDVLDVVEEDLAMTTKPVSSLDGLQKRDQWENELDAWAASHPHLDTIMPWASCRTISSLPGTGISCRLGKPDL